MQILLLILTLTLISASHTAQADSGVPALQVRAPNGKTSILIGSLHVAVANLRQPGPSIFHNATAYVVEHVTDPAEQSRLQHELALAVSDQHTAWAPWAQSLTEAKLAEFVAHLNCLGINKRIANAILKLPTVQLANQLAYTICPPPTGAKSRDDLMEAMKPTGLPEVALEDNDWVEAKRRSVPSVVDDAGFRWVLDHDPKTVLAGVVDALNLGDYASIKRQFDASVGNAEYATIKNKIMVEERNAAWLPHLRLLFKKGNAVVLIGAMHLAGPNGLIALLQQDGFKVSPMRVAEGTGDPADSNVANTSSPSTQSELR